ncbi:MAG: rubredoxin [Oscillospiraceae bacterium]
MAQNKTNGGFAAKRERKCVIIEQYLCPCGYIYNEELGAPADGIAPGTKFRDIPDSWRCPVCGLTKDYFGAREDVDSEK